MCNLILQGFVSENLYFNFLTFSRMDIMTLHFYIHLLQAKGKKRQIGWFPATYVKVLGGSSRSTPVSMELTNREDAPPDQTQTSPTSANPITQVTVTPPTDEPMQGPNDASNGKPVPLPLSYEVLMEYSLKTVEVRKKYTYFLYCL